MSSQQLVIPEGEDFVPVVQDEVVDVPECFFLCDELPATPHGYLGYFSVHVIDYESGETIVHLKLEAPRYGDDGKPFHLHEIRPIIEKEIQRRQLSLLHILFYDDAYRRFQYLSERMAVQCDSLIFRALTEPVPVTPTPEEEEEAVVEVEVEVGNALHKPYAPAPAPTSTRITSLLKDKVSNPPFPDREPGQQVYVSLRDLHDQAEEFVEERMAVRAGVNMEEQEERNEIRKERYINTATLRAVRSDELRDKELRRKKAAIEAAHAQRELESRERQKMLLGQVNNYIQTLAIEDRGEEAEAQAAA